MNSREIRSRLRDGGLPTVIVDIFTSYENDIRFLKKEIQDHKRTIMELIMGYKMLAEGMGGMSRAVDPLVSKMDKMRRDNKQNDIVYSEPIDVVGDPKNNE